VEATLHDVVFDLALPAIGRRNGVGARSPLPRRDLDISKFVRTAIYRRDGNACRWCGSSEQLTLDHVIPQAAGGSDATDNLQTLCRSCNASKGSRPDRCPPRLLPVVELCLGCDPAQVAPDEELQAVWCATCDDVSSEFRTSLV
jgi:hypothetical protein